MFAWGACSAAEAPGSTASAARTKDNVEFIIGPAYADAPELTLKEGVPSGTLHEFTTYRYVFAEAAGHTDGRVTRQTLPGALEWLWQGYAGK